MIHPPEQDVTPPNFDHGYEAKRLIQVARDERAMGVTPAGVESSYNERGNYVSLEYSKSRLTGDPYSWNDLLALADRHVALHSSYTQGAQSKMHHIELLISTLAMSFPWEFGPAVIEGEPYDVVLDNAVRTPRIMATLQRIADQLGIVPPSEEEQRL